MDQQEEDLPGHTNRKKGISLRKNKIAPRTTVRYGTAIGLFESFLYQLKLSLPSLLRDDWELNRHLSVFIQLLYDTKRHEYLQFIL